MSDNATSEHSSDQSVTASRSWKLYLLRVVLIVLGLAAWFGTQALIGGRKAPATPAEMESAGRVVTQGDQLLQWTSPVYEWFAADDVRWRALLISSSAVIDVLTFAILGLAIFGRSIRPFLGLLMLFALRQICQGLSALPPPEGMIWEEPGFPSILVTYGVTNDLFFSGHTAIAVFGAIEIARGGKPWRKIAALGIALFLIASVLLVRAHYMMDVFAGAIAAILCSHWAMQISPRVDGWLARCLGDGAHR